MARPIKDNADYFSHDASMRDDPKIKALRRKFKHEGYSIWNMLLESITDADNFRLVMNYEIMAGDYDIEPEKLRAIVGYCVELGLLKEDAETSIIWSKTLDNRMSGLLSKRKRNRNPADSELSTSINPQSKVKESKGKESIYISIGDSNSKTYIIILARLAGEKPRRVYDLRKHFEMTGQIDGLTERGFVHFDAFLAHFGSKIFNDDMHLDNTFRSWCERYKPPAPARASPMLLNAEVDKQNLRLEAWEELYAYDLKHNQEFRKYFGYGELPENKPVVSNGKH